MSMKPFNRWRPHPWHGLSVGPNPPKMVHAYIEITPYDFVKYEVNAMQYVRTLPLDQRSKEGIVELAYEQLDSCERVYSSLKFDIRKNCENRLKTKIESVEKVLNREVNH